MKSEERHKLQQNELADYLAKAVETIKPYQNAILGGIILVLVIFLMVHWWTGKSAADMEAANTQLYEALGSAMSTNEASPLMATAEKYPDTPAATLAELTAANIHLNTGSGLLFVNKAKANSELGDASDLYQKLLPKLSDPLLIAQANFGLARTEECQNQLAEAKKHYAEVVKISPDGPYAVLAARRLEDIERPSSKEIFDKIANYVPKSFKDESSLFDKMPFDPKNMPQEPLINPDTFGKKLNLKTETKDGAPSEDVPKDVLPPPDDQPAPGQKKPDDAKPADAGQPPPEPVKPAEDAKPTDSGKPADEKPAATPPATDTPAPDTPAPVENNK